MSAATSSAPDWSPVAPPRPHPRAATHDPRWVRVLLIGAALTFLGLFLVLPLVTVFIEALAKGASGIRRSDSRAHRARSDPAHAARRGDLGTRQHDLRNRRGLGDHEVRLPRQAAADHRDRLAARRVARCFGADLRAAVRRQGLLGPG
jgi:hypothetical protein